MIIQAHELPEIRETADYFGWRNVYTAGTFAGLHPEHTRFLSYCAAQGDRTVVMVRSDMSVQRAKNTILLPAEERARLVNDTRMVDFVLIGPEQEEGHTAISVAQLFMPHVVVIGHKWSWEEQDWRDALPGSDIIVAPFEHRYSSTRLFD